MPVLMFQLTHLGSAVQFEQQAAGLSALNDFRIGYALCRQIPVEKFPEHVALGKVVLCTTTPARSTSATLTRRCCISFDCCGAANARSVRSRSNSSSSAMPCHANR